MIDLIKPNYKDMNISRNANSRNRRKMINGFKGEGTPSGFVKTSPYGKQTNEKTLEEREHARRIKMFRATNLNGKHAGSKRTLNHY